MVTTQAEFQAVADELVDDEFADFFPLRTFSKPGVYDPNTGTSTPVTEAVPCMREEYSAGQFDNNLIQVGDFKLLAKVSSFSTITPTTDGLTVTVDGKSCTVIRAAKDAADAMWTIQVRSS